MRGGLLNRNLYRLPSAGPHCETVGIMHLGFQLLPGFLLVPGEPVHRRQRRETKSEDIRAQVQRLLDLHDDAFGA